MRTGACLALRIDSFIESSKTVSQALSKFFFANVVLQFGQLKVSSTLPSFLFTARSQKTISFEQLEHINISLQTVYKIFPSMGLLKLSFCCNPSITWKVLYIHPSFSSIFLKILLADSSISIGLLGL